MQKRCMDCQTDTETFQQFMQGATQLCDAARVISWLLLTDNCYSVGHNSTRDVFELLAWLPVRDTSRHLSSWLQDQGDR